MYKEMLLHLRPFNLAVSIVMLVAVMKAAGMSDPGQMALISVPFLLGTMSVFSMNDVFDAPTDRGKEHELFMQAGTRRALLTFSSGLGLLAAASALFFGVQRFVILIVMLALGLAYSVPPIRLKDRAGADVVVHTLLGGVLPVFYVTTGLSGGVLVLLVFFALVGFISQIWNQVYDFDRDGMSFIRRIGLRNGQLVYIAVCLLGLGFFTYAFVARPLLYLLPPVAMFAVSLLEYKRGRYPAIPWAFYFLFGLVYMVPL
jgi:4-hydroxybenzoate polyprenyltransferase